MNDGAQGLDQGNAVGMLEDIAAHGNARAASTQRILNHLEYLAGGIHRRRR